MALSKTGRRVLIGIGVLIMLLGAAFMYLNNRNRTLSPPGNAELTNGSLSVSVAYSRPSVRERLIFGDETEGALQPWGTYWRLGANEPTEITLNSEVRFNGQKLAAGTYQLYAVPGKDRFKIGVNAADRAWGYTEPDYTNDVFTTDVPVIKSAHTEQHTISLIEGGENEIIMVITFSDVRLEIPIQG
jgi:hypothetical protein